MNKSISKPLFSIITVCFNEVNNIEKTCKSVASQTSKNFEWIVIDGGSTDGTTDILKKYRKNMSYFVSEKDGGVYNAMNKAIKKSKAEYLLFLNGGDYLYNKKVLLNSHNLIKKDKLESEVYFGNLKYEGGEIVDFSKSILNDRFFKTKTISHQATFIRKSLFRKFGLYDEKYRIVADFEFWIRTIVLNGVKTRYLPIIISVFDQGGLSSPYSAAKTLIGERNNVLLRAGLINSNQAKFYELEWLILSFFKRVGVYNFIRRNYRKVIKR